jgi:hypothetical protein
LNSFAFFSFGKRTMIGAGITSMMKPSSVAIISDQPACELFMQRMPRTFGSKNASITPRMCGKSAQLHLPGHLRRHRREARYFTAHADGAIGSGGTNLAQVSSSPGLQRLVWLFVIAGDPSEGKPRRHQPPSFPAALRPRPACARRSRRGGEEVSVGLFRSSARFCSMPGEASSIARQLRCARAHVGSRGEDPAFPHRRTP